MTAEFVKWFVSVLILLAVAWWMLPLVVTLQVKVTGAPILFDLEREGPWIRATPGDSRWYSVRALERQDLDGEIERMLNFRTKDEYLAGDEAFAWFLAKSSLRVEKAPPRWVLRLWPDWLAGELVKIRYPYVLVVDEYGSAGLLERGDG